MSKLHHTIASIPVKQWAIDITLYIFEGNDHSFRAIPLFDEEDEDMYIRDNGNGPLLFPLDQPSYPIQDVTKALNRLTDDLKIPFSMYLSGYKCSEIAEKLNLPLETVEKCIATARENLTRFLNEE